MNFFRSINLVFQKGYSAQHCRLAMWEKWNQAVANSQPSGTVLTDLSKVFDCLPDEFVIAKPNTHEFSLEALKLMNNYLSQKNQRTKLNDSRSSWKTDLL